MKYPKIGYLSWGKSPAQFRRFAKFAQLNNLNAEPYQNSSKYDVLVVTQNSDVSFWHRYSDRSCKIVFDFVDSYLSVQKIDLLGNFRGLAKFVSGQHRYLEIAYRRTLELMMRRADAVVCSTPEQRQEYFAFNQNVHDILDINDNQIRVQKSDYRATDKIHFVWEGMGGNAWAFAEIAPILREIHAQRRIVLHLVTDLHYKAYNGPLAWSYSVKSQLKSILGSIPFYLYEWNPTMLSQICSACDIALLPIPKKPAIYWAKPENRLLMLWRMGLPVLASATPAYLRCMIDAGVDGACVTLDDWRSKLSALIANHDARQLSADRGLEYANNAVSVERLSQKWFRVLESVL